MQYTIGNEFLTIAAEQRGAQLMSIKDRDDTEYIWQGDPKYWEGHAPNLFPYVGRTVGGQYEYKGKTYNMPIHGFAPNLDYELIEHTNDSMLFRLQNNAETIRYYPWQFCFDIEYCLQRSRLQITYSVKNLDDKTMYFGLGGHPGFRLPIHENEEFSDYQLRFLEACQPKQVLFNSSNFTTGELADYHLEKGDRIPLSMRMFDNGTIALKQTSKTVALENIKTGKGVTVSFPQMDHIALWHPENTKAPFLCIEPWCSLPSPAGKKTVFEKQADLLKLLPGEVYENVWSIEIPY